MDDLRMLRDLGQELEHEPPASLVRQRDRYRESPRRRFRLSGWPVLGLAAAATAAAVAVPMVLIGGQQPLAGSTVPGPAGARPYKANQALNVLLIGSDTRRGEGNAKYGPLDAKQERGARADTMILLHLSADGKWAAAVNLPRDSMVDLPACEQTPAMHGMLNAALANGGLRCAWAAVESVTKVRVDHAVEVDFSGFKEMVDAVGTVRVEVPRPIDDRKSKLKLPAGVSELNGEQALGYFRLRAYGDGSDLQRIKRQQDLLASLIREVRSDPTRIGAFIEAASKAAVTDEGLGVKEMSDIARGMAEAEVSFHTVPWITSRRDPNRIEWKQPDAARLFKKIAHDQPIGR
ncbi:LCP family protein [Nonomuraea africana]|uniref:LCP family protein required for cell wall assembly n=1 Tax=Nonomuraea africana TaxID=46171 RepID=A0ABR9KTR6_9ACTN|nr:LCP family protein [Nonomuraea africana]MBE1564897.1 LCP family protein required for cell wall assembly [Nonomuraea africana]